MATIATVATVGLAAGGAGLAAGSPSPPNAGVSAKLPQGATLAQIQAAATTAIKARVGSLNSAVAGVQKRTDLGPDQAVLLHSLQADLTGLQQLGVKIRQPPTRRGHEPTSAKSPPISGSTP